MSQLPLPLARPIPTGVHTIPRRAKIHVNRNLRLDALSAVGFDLDYTLAIYRQAEMDQLQIRVTVEKLVELGHPSSLLDVSYPTDFAIRGLHVDKKLGNVLKMDRYRYVKRAYHGMRKLPRDERRRLYHQKPVLPGTKRYHWVDTLYVLPEVSVFAAAVEHLEADGRAVDYAKLFDDVRASIDLAHQDGSVVNVIAKDPERFVERDPLLPATLERLRTSGKKVFLVTNSSPTYTATMLAYLLDEPLTGVSRWRSYFDGIVAWSKKPRFFTEPDIPIVPGEDDLEAPNGTLEPGRIYQGGCLPELERYLGVSGDEILYVGDHIYGDVLRAKKESAWRTMMIVQEMGAELEGHDQVAGELERLDEIFEVSELLHDELRTHQSQLRAVEHLIAASEHPSASVLGARVTHRHAIERVKGKIATLDEERERLEDLVDSAYHPYWGSLFKAGPEVSSFGDQIEQYACLYTDRVSNLLQYAPTHYFRGPRDRMPHEL